jgi:hypothetical protein
MRRLLPLGAAVALALASGAVAQVQPPAGAVATVGDTAISKGTFDAWIDAPEARRRDVMAFLIRAQWVRGESRLRGIEVTPTEVRRSFRRQKRQAFENERQYRRYLRDSGLTQRQILFQVEVDLLRQRLTREVMSRAEPVSGRDIRKYIRSHRRGLRELTRAERRRKARRILTLERQTEALEAFVRDFRRRWRAVTVCAKGYIVAECSNAAARR